MPKKIAKRLIGATDFLDLPKLGLANIPCKIDTGARTSTLHCRKVKVVEKNGKDYLIVSFHDPKFGIHLPEPTLFEDFSEKKVRSSNGELDYRYSIKTPVLIFGKTFLTEFTLSFREKMKFPILLGRRFLRKQFIVDVSLKDLSSKQKKQE